MTKKQNRATRRESRDILSRYDSYSRDELVRYLDTHIGTLPEELRGSVRFEIDMESQPYDTSEYPNLYMVWDRPETDEEMETRELEARAVKVLNTARELQEFKRLQQIYGDKQ